ncbi:guanine nucleotide-binding protein alpha-3 subunit [Stemphylium lycopersici]|uniref:Guanine nucleotide-binding protein alpha-3 subunit n=1 Tax=Stemphylium lycopersici TaxID=183478 RepID=A0A364NGJ9_STELY|nr:guanine nucleotide-binding protein alpha-3 subunit [Stemphylium lycopersici]
MADDKTVFALISAIGSIRDRLRQDIDGLRHIHNRWRDSKGTSINLIAQLTALKSTLGNIQDWLEYAVNDLHPQLLSDLQVLTHSCDELVRHVNVLTRRFGQSDLGAVDFAAKLKYALASRTMRKILLHKSRQIRKEDAKNLRTLSQSSMWNGGCITGLTQLSSFIQWLRLIFRVKPSQNELDRNFSPTDEEYNQIEAINRSEAIDRALQREATNLRHETKLVLAGNVNSGKDLIMHQLKVLYAEGYYSNKERIKYRCQIYQVVYSLIHSITTLLQDTGVALPSELNHDFATLLNELEAGNEGITPDAVKAIDRIWSSPEFSKLYVRNFEIDFPQYAPYFAQEVSRIARQDYVPSEADIIRLNQSMRGIKELRFNWDELDVHLFNIKGYVPEHFRDRWFHQLEGATALIYAMDVSLYDKPNPGQPNESLLVSEFESFESWINQPGFADSSVILILNNFTRFIGKMAFSPLEKFFPDYTPSEVDPETSARQYILRHLKSVNRQGLSIYSFWVDLDSSDNRHLYSALKTTLAQIQQRVASDEAWNAGDSATNSERPSTNSMSKVLNSSRTRSLGKKKDRHDRMKAVGLV